MKKAKRGAAKQLTHDNWDQEEEVVDAGEFIKASEETLKERVFIKAKRKIAGSQESTESSSPFAKFSGFASTNSKSTFSGFSFESNNSEKKKNDDSSSDNKKIVNSQNGFKSELSSSPVFVKSPDNNNEYSDEYYESLKCLNSQVMSWLQKYMSESSYCIFTPVFKDYENHLNALEAKYKVRKCEDAKKPCSVSSTGSTGFSFGTSNKSSLSDSIQTPTTCDAKTKENFSFGLPPTASSTKPTSTFSFAAQVKKAKESAAPPQTTGDDEYKPPENEFEEVKEEDSFYSIRCKLFYKKGNDFVDKGIGNLYLKKTNDKTQLLVRADTSLGNVLLNIVLSGNMPAVRMGKNNVMITCMMNPPVEKIDSDVPTPLLIRVKNGDAADNLLEMIEKNKASN